MTINFLNRLYDVLLICSALFLIFGIFIFSWLSIGLLIATLTDIKHEFEMRKIRIRWRDEIQ